MERTWLDACADFSALRSALPEALEALAAFRTSWPRGGPLPPPEAAFAGDFEELEREVLERATFDGLGPELAGEVDEAQAAMFERRLRAVDRLERALDRPEARLLRVGLRIRLAGIREAQGPRALRVRALADFHSISVRYWESQSIG